MPLRIFIFLFQALVFVSSSFGQTLQRDPALDSPGSGWVKVIDNVEFVFWLHPPTASRGDGVVQIWGIGSRRLGHENCSFRLGSECAASHRTLLQFDCQQRRFRSLTLSMHTEAGARGRLIMSENAPRHWFQIPPSTHEEALMTFACN